MGIFTLTGDAWMKEPGSVEWTDGKGVFINNYSNFVLFVNLEDQLRLVSVAKGQDLKYVLLRLQKAVARIEEALKMVFLQSPVNNAASPQKMEDFHTQEKLFMELDLKHLSPWSCLDLPELVGRK